MALTPKKVYAILKKYTDDAVAGAGTIKGKNCVINSITPITGGNRVEFQWTLDNGTVQTDTMDVMDGVDGVDGTNGVDGVGIVSITFKQKDTDGSNIYTITYTDGNADDIICPIGPQGPAGADGQDGADGADGAPGVGVPTGGTTGQVLKKKSGTDYDTEWADESGGGSEHGIPDGGTANQILAKNSNTDYDVHWVDPASSSQEQSDWIQNDSSKVDYIKNKPENLVQDANYVHTDNNYTDADKTIVANVTTDLAGKVDKNGTDRLMTAAEGTKLAGIETGAQVNVLEGVQVNGVDLTIDANKKVNVVISGKADKVVGATNGNFAVLDSNGNLVDSTKSPSSYYLKTETYNQTEINNLISAISTMNIEVVQTLPTTNISMTTLYLVPKTVGTSTTNIYDEYICTDNTTTPATWELIGSTEVDLTNYVQKSSTAGLLKNDGTVDTNTYITSTDISGKADKVSGATSGHFAGLDSTGNLTDSGVDANELNTKADLTDLASEFSSSASYSKGSYVTYNGDVYRFTSAHSAGAWTGSDVTKITIGEELENKQDTLIFDEDPIQNSTHPVYSGGVYRAMQSWQTSMSRLSDVAIAPFILSDGQVLKWDSVDNLWKNKDIGSEFVRYGGSKTFADLTASLLVSTNVDKFFLCTDGGTISSADAANWVLPVGSVIPADSHIAVIEYTVGTTTTYKFDDFGGYVDISGKADKTELDGWTTAVQTLDGTTVTFSNLDDSYGYDLYCENKLVSPETMTRTVVSTGIVTITYTVSGASIGDYFKLRILK